MRIFAVSDIHVDFDANAQWLTCLSTQDYRNDFLILAGDISDSLRQLEKTLITLVNRFGKVFFVPGNHDLWVDGKQTSLDKFIDIRKIMENCGVSGTVWHGEVISIIPLLGWYDYSFGEPSDELKAAWMDFRFCKWPQHLRMRDVAARFMTMNLPLTRPTNNIVISFSHFLPRIDVMPHYIPVRHRLVYPVLGSDVLEQQIRMLRSDIHVYGHSHVNRRIPIEGITYINNAFGYPWETNIASKRLLCIYG